MNNFANENGYTQFPNDLLEIICKTDISAVQLKILLIIIRNTIGYHKELDWLSPYQIADALEYQGDHTHIYRALRVLEKRFMIIKRDKYYGPNRMIHEWILKK